MVGLSKLSSSSVTYGAPKQSLASVVPMVVVLVPMVEVPVVVVKF
jgi:hypothetical protein